MGNGSETLEALTGSITPTLLRRDPAQDASEGISQVFLCIGTCEAV